MILMGDGSAKEGHDAITQNLIDRALIAMHGIHHAMQDWVEKPLRHLGIEVLNQLCGAFDVGKQDGHLLAIAFKGGAGVQDLLGKALGGISEWWTVLAAGRKRYRVGSGALGARPD
jgi:hypothetical protein